MTPTEEQLCSLWNAVRKHFIRNQLTTRSEAIAFAEDEASFAFDLTLIVVDKLTEADGSFLGEAEAE